MLSSASALAGSIATAATSLRFILSVLRVGPPPGIASGPAVCRRLGISSAAPTDDGRRRFLAAFLCLGPHVGQCESPHAVYSRSPTFQASSAGPRVATCLRTSRLRIRPPMPVPLTSARSTPCSSASIWTTGEIPARPVDVVAGGQALGGRGLGRDAGGFGLDVRRQRLGRGRRLGRRGSLRRGRRRRRRLDDGVHRRELGVDRLRLDGHDLFLGRFFLAAIGVGRRVLGVERFCLDRHDLLLRRIRLIW